MCSSIRSSSIFFLLFFYASVTKCWDLEKVAEKLQELVDVESSLRISRDSEDVSSVWFDYEFNTGVGNREELVVTDISVHEYANVPKTGTKWQFLEVNGTGYLIRGEKSILSFHKLDPNDALTNEPVTLDIKGVVLTFKVISHTSFRENADSMIDLVAILCVTSDNGTSLQWYRLLDGGSFQCFWSWPVQKHAKSIELVQYGNLNKLLLLDENEMRFGRHYSYIDVYGFSIDFSTSDFHFWLCQRIPAPRVFDIQVCSIYEGVTLAVQGMSDVFFYEYKDNTVGSIFQTIKSQDLKNFVCFESGYLQYLAISGPEAGLFHFYEGEFQYNAESEPGFDVSDISWIKDVRLDTYRDESLLLIQLRNFTVIALSWQGSSFGRIQLPSNILDQFDLSRVTVVPKFGFVLDNRFVKFHVYLRNLKHPIQQTTERLLSLQRLLNDSLNHQEEILDETEKRLDKSYLKNPVITGVWNISQANATNATVTDNVIYHSATIGSVNLTRDELSFDVKAYAKKLQDLEKKLEETEANLIDALNSNSTRLSFDSDVEIFGNVEVLGNLSVENLTARFINDIDVADDFEDKRTFSSLEAEDLTIFTLNGIPMEDIRFGDSIVDYRDVNFSRINRAIVGEHLFFETINNVEWETLMKNIVWKNKPANIPGNTVIEGVLIADNVHLNFLNDLSYPDDYVLRDGDTFVNVTGSKSFDVLVTEKLKDVKTINGIDFEDFVILNKHNVLSEEITFENLTVEGPLVIDGKIETPEEGKVKLLNETSTDIILSNVTVLGNVFFEKLFMDEQPLDLEDLLLKTEENVEITGTKTFLGNVGMISNVTIMSGRINDHFMDEFVTLDTDQELPNLTKISSNVTFGNVTFGITKKLEALFKGNSSSNCLEKRIVFESPIVVDEFSFDSLNDNVSEEEFARKVNESFQNIRLEHLTTKTLIAENIVAGTVNGVDFANFVNRSASPNVINEFVTDNLEIERLDVKFINGISLDEINRLMEHLETFLVDFSRGNVTLESLRVTGKIDVKSINGQVLKDMFEADRMIFKESVFVKNLTILGSMNGYNFSERVSDTVLKTDRDIKITGLKTFDTVNCHQLEMVSLNGHPVENLLDPLKEQVLTGPVVVNGSVTILNDFNTTGNIGDVPFQELMNRFKYLGNKTFQYQGDVRFPENVSIENLLIDGTVQGTNFDSFVNTVVLKNEDNVTISGRKVFENHVTFNGPFDVHDKLNDIDLKMFREKAVFIDKPFSVKSKIIFKDGIKAEKELTVHTKLDAKSIMGVDINDLKLNVLYLNRPTYIKETITFTDVSFESNIEVEKINDVDTRLLIPLKTDQIIPVKALRCRNVTVENIKILGKINEQDWNTFQENTFMLFGNQNITGHINFHGHVYARHNFNARRVNGIDPSRMIPLNSKSQITGNFVFEKPVVMNKSLRVLGYLNDINPNRWQAVAVTTHNSLQQIISGNWTVIGNVHLSNGAVGSDILNGTNMTELWNALAQNDLEMDSKMLEINANLESMCKDLKHLKGYSEKQIYEFSAFDYLQIIEFESRIVSVHHFELDELDYLMISYNTCQMHMYLFTGTKFELVVNVPDFGEVDRWSTFRHDGVLHFLTYGTNSCGRSSVNLWKLENDEITHVLNLGHKIGSRMMNLDSFSTLIDDKDEKFAARANMELEQFLSSLANDGDMEIILQNDHTFLSGKRAAYEYDIDSLNSTSIEKRSGNPKTLNFKAGVFEKEMYLYYNEDVSKDRVFILSNYGKKKIVQTIKAHRPTLFVVLNFEGSIETLLIFVENGNNLRIYEYKGIQGFVYRDSIGMNIDKLFSFKIRKYPNLAKRHCIALIYGNRLTILEANMYGEKLDMETFTCSGR